MKPAAPPLVLVMRVRELASRLGVPAAAVTQAQGAGGVAVLVSGGEDGVLIACSGARPVPLARTTPDGAPARNTAIVQVVIDGKEPWVLNCPLPPDGGLSVESAPRRFAVVSPEVAGMESVPGVRFYRTLHEAVIEQALEGRVEGLARQGMKAPLLLAADAIRLAASVSCEGSTPKRAEAAFWYALTSTFVRHTGTRYAQALEAILDTAGGTERPTSAGGAALARWLLQDEGIEARIGATFVRGDRTTSPLGLYWLTEAIQSPVFVDSDSDGLPDWFEPLCLTDPNLRDTDGDGIDDSLQIISGPRPPVAAPAPAQLPEEALRPRRVAYLTFDDGPSKNVTPFVLQVLREKSVKATFFIVGLNALRLPRIVLDIAKEGHSIGNHSYDHDYGFIYSSPERYVESLDRCGEILHSITGVRPTTSRPPGGSQGRLTQMYYRALKEKGYRTLDWNVSTRDTALPSPTTSQMVQSVITYAKSKGADLVVLMHDGPGHRATALALGEIIDGLRRLGYAFDVLRADAPLPELGGGR